MIVLSSGCLSPGMEDKSGADPGNQTDERMNTIENKKIGMKRRDRPLIGKL